MEQIVIEVDGALAKAWKNSSPALRSSYENKITAILRELKEAEFGNLLDRTGKIAEKNGLTEVQLEILKQDAAEHPDYYDITKYLCQEFLFLMNISLLNSVSE